MTRPPTKADLAAAVERLTQEKAGLLGLIKVISETAALPIEAVDGDRGYYFAHRAMAITIGQVCGMAADGTLGSLAWGAQYIRSVRAEQEAKYEHCAAPAAAAAPEGLEDAAAQDDDEADDRPVALLACGDQLTTDEVVTGDLVTCPRHGKTTVVSLIGDQLPAPSGLQDPAPVVRVIGDVCMMAGCGHAEHRHQQLPGRLAPGCLAINCKCRRYLSPERSGFIAADSPVLRGARIGGGQ